MNLSFSSKKTNLFGAWPHSTFINYTDYIQSLLVYKTFSSFFLSGSLAHPSFSSLVTFQLIEFSFNEKKTKVHSAAIYWEPILILFQ